MPERIANEQLCDDVIKDAIIQLRKERRVITGGLKKVGDRLSVVNGKFLFKERLVVPKMLREEVMRSVHAQHHFGKEGYNLSGCYEVIRVDTVFNSQEMKSSQNNNFRRLCNFLHCTFRRLCNLLYCTFRRLCNLLYCTLSILHM